MIDKTWDQIAETAKEEVSKGKQSTLDELVEQRLNKHKQTRYKMTKELIPPVQKGQILKLGVRSIGKNGDLMFMHNKFRLFLKNKNPERQKDIGTKDIDSVCLNDFLEVRVVKLFPKLAYVELTKKSKDKI